MCHAQVTLETDNSEASARVVKARVERTTLGQIARSIRAVLRPAYNSQVCTPHACMPAVLHRMLCYGHGGQPLVSKGAAGVTASQMAGRNVVFCE